jgi:hypothetical protein
MSPGDRAKQLAELHELARLTIGRGPRDAARLERIESILRHALEEATRDHEAYAAVDAHIARELAKP